MKDQESNPEATLAAPLSSSECEFSGKLWPSGEAAFSSMSVAEIADLALREPIGEELIQRIRRWRQKKEEDHLLLLDDVNPDRLDQAGWGVVFPRDGAPGFREALEPLISWRRNQVGVDSKRFRVFEGKAGYLKGETRLEFLDRQQAAYSVVDPERLPYYLLFVGSPEEIPFRFQNHLDLDYAIGRLDFETAEEYAAYAESTVGLEADSAPGEGIRRAVFFGPTDDRVGRSIVRELVEPLVERLAKKPVPGWELDVVVGNDATHRRLTDLLVGANRPELLFTAGHGIRLESGAHGQEARQGGLWCQGQALFAEDLEKGQASNGPLMFHFACFGAGTNSIDEFESQAAGQRVVRAPRPFTARLPKTLLGSRRVRAVIGHVGRTWTTSFQRVQASGQLTTNPDTAQIDTFEMSLRRLMEGRPVGHALEPFNSCAAYMAAELAHLRELSQFGAATEGDLARVFQRYMDARNFVVLGDPAVRLPDYRRVHKE
jgi:hypothetical protein